MWWWEKGSAVSNFIWFSCDLGSDQLYFSDKICQKKGEGGRAGRREAARGLIGMANRMMHMDEDQYLLTLLLNSFSEMGWLTLTFS